MARNFDKDQIIDESLNLNREYIDFLAERNRSIQEFTKMMQTKFSYLYSNFQSIFNMCITKNYDHERLTKMVNMAYKVNKNEITEHDASVAVGQILVDDIVKPQLDKKN